MPLGSLHPPAIIHIASRTKFSCMREREEGLLFFEDNHIFLNRSRKMSSTPSGPLCLRITFFSISLISLRIYPFACAHFPPCLAFTSLISARMSSCSKGGREFLTRNFPEKHKWSRGYDEGGFRYGDMTSNMVEFFNNVIKGVCSLPVTAIVKYTFFKLNCNSIF